jgi:hypothetical protein
MMEPEEILVRTAIDRLRPLAQELVDAGWRPELVVLAPTELGRIAGYKVALVVPLDSIPEGD